MRRRNPAGGARRLRHGVVPVIGVVDYLVVPGRRDCDGHLGVVPPARVFVAIAGIVIADSVIAGSVIAGSVVVGSVIVVGRVVRHVVIVTVGIVTVGEVLRIDDAVSPDAGPQTQVAARPVDDLARGSPADHHRTAETDEHQ